MKVLVVDSSQIEARVVAWLAGDGGLLGMFADPKRDIYAEKGSEFFGRKITKETDPDERQCSKALVLGCGFNMGWYKFAGEMLKGMFGAPPVQFREREVEMLRVDVDKFAGSETKMERVENMPSRLPIDARVVHCAVAENLIYRYRDANKPIVELWDFMANIIAAMDSGEEFAFGPNDCLRCVRHGIVLPSGLVMRYNGLREGEDGYSYMGGRGGKERVRIYGGSLTENVVQAVARCIVFEQMLMIRGKYGLMPITTTHDELVYAVEDDKAAFYLGKVLEEMCAPPVWAAGLPLGASGGYGDSYGKAGEAK